MMMTIPFVDLKAQYERIRPDIDRAIGQVVEETAFVRGKHVDQFEAAFADAIGVKHCVGVGNGTDAIQIVLRMLGIGAGDEVITTAVSWISTSEMISITGATPVFVDIDPVHYTIDPEQVAAAITARTRAILPVHLYGQMADMDAIMDIAARHGLEVIEDCAQSHFSRFKGSFAGTFGRAATFSFYPGKNLGAYGDAGCIVTDDDELADKCRMYANHGQPRKNRHLFEGINSRLDGIQAAILSAKLPHIGAWNDARRRWAQLYDDLLVDTGDLDLPVRRTEAEHSFHIYGIRTSRRDELHAFLREKGIGCGIHYPTPLPMMEAYQYLELDPGRFQKASLHADTELSLPLYPEMGEERVEAVTRAVKQFFISNGDLTAER